MNRHRQPVSLLQATKESPTLARLTALVDDSSARLSAIESLMPPALRSGIQAGPIDGSTWCLVAANSAIAAKLRQILPSLESHLRAKGWDVNSIRLKIQTSKGS
jgi:hypothetical protein